MKSIFNFLPKAKVKICIPNEPEPSSVTIIGLNLIYSEYDFNSQFWISLISAFLVIWIFLKIAYCHIQNVNTIVYKLDETEKSMAVNAPKFTIQRLDYTEEYIGDRKRKTFYIDEPSPDGNSLIILSFGKEKVVVNVGLLEDDKVSIIKKPMPISFKTLYNETEFEYKEVEYTPNLKRPISIIDPETTEEVKPILYFDEETNEVKGKCKLKPFKNYFAFEVRDSK